MSVRLCICLCSFLLLATSAMANVAADNRTLRVYGPGGPHRVLEECADLFEEKHGLTVLVNKALPHDLERRLREDGDIYYGGAEYMLTEFDSRNPGLLDMTTAENLHPRRIGVVVRAGNPRNINSAEDLQQEGLHLLDVKLENMRHFHGEQPGVSRNVRRFEYTGQQGMAAWRSSPEIDAWVTYRSWQKLLAHEAEFVELPGESGLRYTPMALTHRTPLRDEARLFIDFLKSDEARRVFEGHGWY